MISFLFSLAIAADLPGEPLFEKPQAAPALTLQNEDAKSKFKPRGPQPARAGGNLPSFYLSLARNAPPGSELVRPPKGSLEVFRGLKVGDIMSAQVRHSVIAFPDEKAPVVADISDRKYRGLKLIGVSSLEQNSHRVFIEFNRVVANGKVYSLKAQALTNDGQPGLAGEFHSREAEYFGGDFLSSFVAGYFDGLVPRTTNAYGQVQDDPSVNTAMKKGLSAGAMSTAERFREKLKKVPEFSELRGPIDIQILILEQGRSI